MKLALIYPLAALAEIAGCFAFWAWLKLDRSPLWLAPGVVCLIAFAWLLTLVPAEAAGRAWAPDDGAEGVPAKAAPLVRITRAAAPKPRSRASR